MPQPVGIAAGIVGILQGAIEFVRVHRLAFATTWLATLVVSALLYPYDEPLLRQVQAAGEGYENLARWLSHLGRFENSTLALAVLLGIAGLVSRRPSFRDAAVACLLAGLVAGIGAVVLRPTLGRARPEAEVESGFHWFEMDSKLQSMPSGHATSNAASAVAVVMVMPAVGIPATAVVAGICWSRLELNRHYPTDVLWGVVLGSSVGVAVGSATRDRRRRALSRSTARS